MNIKGWSIYEQGIEVAQFYIDGIFYSEILLVNSLDIEKLYPQYSDVPLGYELRYDISSLSNGVHELKIVIIDIDGIENSQTLEFIVSNK